MASAGALRRGTGTPTDHAPNHHRQDHPPDTAAAASNHHHPRPRTHHTRAREEEEERETSSNSTAAGAAFCNYSDLNANVTRIKTSNVHLQHEDHATTEDNKRSIHATDSKRSMRATVH